MVEKGLRVIRCRWLFSALLIVSALILAAGCGQLLPKPPVEQLGTIVLTLSRAADVEPGSLRVAFLSEMNPSSESDWQRRVEDVLAVLEGYRIRVQGEGVDVIKDALFEEGEDEVTIEIGVPVGDDYSVGLLALGDLHPYSKEYNLLGAGRTTGVSVNKDEPTFVEVHMEPYQYRFEAPEQAEIGAEISIRYEIKGALLSEVVFIPVRLSYLVDGATMSDKTGTREEIGDNHWSWDFTLPGRPEQATLEYYTWTRADGWDLNGGRTYLMAPSTALGEELLVIQIGGAGGKVIVDPVW